MLQFIKGNLFDSKCQTWVNTVNCVGVMGKGIALTFKIRFPEMYQRYHHACAKGWIQTGKVTIDKGQYPWVINFPTKDAWWEDSQIEWINKGLDYLVIQLPKWKITSLAIPALGCNNGGLHWLEVKELIENYLGNLPIEVEVYEPL